MRVLYQIEADDNASRDFDIDRLNEAYNLLAYRPPLTESPHGKSVFDWPKCVGRLRGGIFRSDDPDELRQHVKKLAQEKTTYYGVRSDDDKFAQAAISGARHAIEIADAFVAEWDRLYTQHIREAAGAL
jgi:hypothetical protein